MLKLPAVAVNFPISRRPQIPLQARNSGREDLARFRTESDLSLLHHLAAITCACLDGINEKSHNPNILESQNRRLYASNAKDRLEVLLDRK